MGMAKYRVNSILLGSIIMLSSLSMSLSRVNIPSQVICPVNGGAPNIKSEVNFVKQSRRPIFYNSLSTIRGGAESRVIKENYSFGQKVKKNLLGLWGIVQVVSILANAIKRLFPVAMQPILQRDILPFQWALYGLWSFYMIYTEGYKAFQLKFSPLVVERSFGLSQNVSFINVLLAGPYSMGLFGAPKRRMIVSWSLTAGIFALVKLVKLLPYPYRSIVDAGVVAGLSYGTLSILFLTAKALFKDESKKEPETA